MGKKRDSPLGAHTLEMCSGTPWKQGPAALNPHLHRVSDSKLSGEPENDINGTKKANVLQVSL